MRVVVWITLITLIAISGCGVETEEAGPAPETQTAPETQEQETAAPARSRPTEVEMVAWMEAHYGAVILAHDALLQGNLEAFKSQLALVPDQPLPPSTPDSWLPLHERLLAAARQGANVSDPNTAANTLAQVVLACGTCHAALGTGPIYPAPAPDDGDHALEAAMLEHEWATERLWEGVTGPWENAWERGAESLATLQVFGDASPELVLTEDLRRREQELREIGELAVASTSLDERAALYARLLTTCGACHQAIGVRFEEPE